MNEYGALVEWYWQGKTEVLGEEPLPLSLSVLLLTNMKIQSVPYRERSASITITSRWVLCKEMIDYFENHMERTNTLLDRLTIDNIGFLKIEFHCFMWL
jgi:uncharacterized membrane protein YpjA